jgi:hypothetical protein
MGAVAAVNAEHRSCSAVSRIAGATEFALPTTRIDLTDDALPAVFNNTNKLMPDRSIETRIPTRDLEIGITDPRQNDAHERLISALRLLYLFDCEIFFIDAEGKHFYSPRMNANPRFQSAFIRA